MTIAAGNIIRAVPSLGGQERSAIVGLSIFNLVMARLLTPIRITEGLLPMPLNGSAPKTDLYKFNVLDQNKQKLC